MRRELNYVRTPALVITALLCLGLNSLAQKKADIPEQGEFFYVVRVIDGDTLKLSNDKKVRLIGIDTPELHHGSKLLRDARRSHKDEDYIRTLGRRAADFTSSLVLNRKVRLEYDVEKRDRYKRLLAYVYLEDGTFVNAEIIEGGYAQILTIPPNVKYADEFLRKERSARENKKGLWADDDYKALHRGRAREKS